MKKHLSEITKRMGLNTSELDINYNPTHLTAETTIDSMTIKVDPALTASISFKPAFHCLKNMFLLLMLHTRKLSGQHSV